MTTIIYICGLYSIGFALFHIAFWSIFNWKKYLPKLNFANKAIMQIFNVQAIYYFLFIAFVCFYCPLELQTTTLGKIFLGGTSLFWLIRTINQLIFLPVNDMRVHILTILFIIGTVLFAVPLFL